MKTDLKVGDVTLFDVEIRVKEDGNFEYLVPDIFDCGDSIQQVTIENGVGEPVLKAAVLAAVQVQLEGEGYESLL